MFSLINSRSRTSLGTRLYFPAKGEKLQTVCKNFLLFGVLSLVLLAVPGISKAGLKTDNVIEATSDSMTIRVKAPSENVGDGVSQMIMVVNKEDNPEWHPEDGRNYTQEVVNTISGELAKLTIQSYVNVQESLFTQSRGIGVKVDQPVGKAPVFDNNKISRAGKRGLYVPPPLSLN